MKSLVYLLSLLSGHSFAQNAPCLKLFIDCNKKVIPADSLGFVEIGYQITNCSNDAIDIDTLQGLGYNDLGLESDIFFKVYKLNGGNYEPYKFPLADMGLNDSEGTLPLEPRKAYKYNFKLLPLYPLKETGSYRIEAYYQVFLSDNPGAYVTKSNRLDIEVK